MEESRDRSRSPRDRKKRREDTNERSHERKRHHDRHHDHSLRDDRQSSSHSHSHKRKHKEKQRDRDRSDHRHAQDAMFDPHRRIKEEPLDHFQEQQQHRQQNDDRRRQARQRREQESGNDGFGRPSGTESDANAAAEKEKPNFELSGKLTEDTNTYRGVVIKYNEPAEARKPKRRWRLYGFKGDDSLPMLPIHRQSAYLLGRDRRVADIPVDHPSCSKQHAVLQHRLTEYERPDGTVGRRVRPYIIDLGSANGTYVNNERIESQRYVELFERDLIKFGYSTREYVLLTEASDTSEVAENDSS